MDTGPLIAHSISLGQRWSPVTPINRIFNPVSSIVAV
jgi:hypothetical protein